MGDDNNGCKVKVKVYLLVLYGQRLNVQQLHINLLKLIEIIVSFWN